MSISNDITTEEEVLQDIITQLLEIYVDDPVAFVEDILGVEPDPWQKEVLNDIANHSHVSVRSGQGVGKTAMESWICIWFLCCRPYPKIICTAPTKQQLYDVLWAEIAKWLNSSQVKDLLKWTKTKIYMKGFEDRWFATAKTATRPENMQGFHEDYMLFIADEASGIADDIMEAILGTLSGSENKLFMCGNPTKTSGVFFDSHNKDRSLYKSHKVSSEDSPRTSKKNIDMLKKKYGEGSDVYRVRVEGEFPRGEADAFISLETAEAARMREVYKVEVIANEEEESSVIEIIPDTAVIEIGCDVARFGSDETIIATRRGWKVLPLQVHHQRDTMYVSGLLVQEAKKYFSWCERTGKRIPIRIDDTGVGGGVTDRLKEVVAENDYPIDVIPINFGSKGNAEYACIVSVMYGHFKDNCLEFVSIPDDEDLIAQLSVRKYQINSDGRIKIEPKKAMKDRGLKSPDRAEAVVMAFAPFYPKVRDRSKRPQRKRKGREGKSA
ncbi:DEAD/DEAH box helicase family protein [Bacillus cereus group sp. BY25LC]|uniref:DEAD/DEAH box helicase family protein n=1 Tax=Bacillus cereus group sp. BY25LC TaxID=3018080 RepID=UPI0022E4C8B7|nr:DEAD/DEAH box helicase family protein [Bacillus cereus group sp. BY25LC]MDA1828515.1 DEAD/DEAH box helicase family protein [Bacillus cereus group sp. BY25LC]